jgi:hypothetical protein
VAAALVAALAIVWTGRPDVGHRVVNGSTTEGLPTTPGDPWPAKVAVIVASDRGVERVAAENGQATVTRLIDGVAVLRAFEMNDGLLIFQRKSGDIMYRRTNGDQGSLVKWDKGLTLQDADYLRGDPQKLRLVYTTENPPDPNAATFDLNLWFQPASPASVPPVGYWMSPVDRFTLRGDADVVAMMQDDTGNLYPGAYQIAGHDGVDSFADGAIHLVGDGSNSIGKVMTDGTFTVTGASSGLKVVLADPTTIDDLDLRSVSLAVHHSDGSSMLVDLASGVVYPVPVADGAVTVSRRDPNGVYPVPTTMPRPPDTTPLAGTTVPSTVPSTTAARPTTMTPVPVAAAGSDGVWVYGPGDAVQWTAEPMAFALLAPDGSMIMQRARGGQSGSVWTPNATLPLRQASPGAPLEDLFSKWGPGASVVAGWYTLHDAADVDGHPMLLMDRQAEFTNGLDTPPGVLLSLDLSTGAVTQIADFGGWEESSSRLHLATNGLIVGEVRLSADRRLFSASIGGAVALTPADLGVKESYNDCLDCPRLYSVSRDGSVVAWLAGSTLKRRAWIGDSTLLPDVVVGDPAGAASDLDIGRDSAALDQSEGTSPPVLVSVSATVDPIHVPGTHLTLAG